MDPQNPNPDQPNPSADPISAVPVEPVGGSTPIGGGIEPPSLPISQPYDPLAPSVTAQSTVPAGPSPLPPEPLPQPPAPAPFEPGSDQIQPEPVQPPAPYGTQMPSMASIQPGPALTQPEPATANDPYALPTQPDSNITGFNLTNSTTPPWVASAQNQPGQPFVSEPPTPNVQDAVPTDLSHLVDNPLAPATGASPVVAQPQTLVMPTAPDPNQAVANTTSKGFPKVLLILAGLVLIMVAGASAYFILGIGKPQENIEGGSIPAQPAVPTPVQTIPTAQPTLMPGSEGTSSATFGNVNGSTGSSRLQTSPTPTSGTSAIDLLRRRSATATPTP